MKNKSNNKKKTLKKKNLSKNNKDFKDVSVSLEDVSLLDYKTKKSFSVATSLSNYKSKTYIGEIYDYKPLHDKINNMCIKNIIKKKPHITTKVSKNICECIFDKNKDLSINDLDTRLKNKNYIPSIDCITIYDKYKPKNHMNNSSMPNSLMSNLSNKILSTKKKSKTIKHKTIKHKTIKRKRFH